MGNVQRSYRHSNTFIAKQRFENLSTSPLHSTSADQAQNREKTEQDEERSLPKEIRVKREEKKDSLHRQRWDITDLLL